MKKNHLPIGILDSGLGGLTVLKALQKEFPNESFISIPNIVTLVTEIYSPLMKKRPS